MADRACPTCGHSPVDPELDSGLCDTCDLALLRGFSIEEARFEVEDGAAFWSKHLGRAEGKRCDCSAKGRETFYVVENHRRRPTRRVGVVHYDIPHDPGCPLAPPELAWGDVDETERQRIFGYDGRQHHTARLAAALQALLDDRRWLEDAA